MEIVTSAKTYFFEQFPNWVEATEVADITVQRELWERMASSEELAQWCLRCFISSQIDQVCRNLSMKFGNRNGFTYQDLLPFVLDDDGRSWRNSQYRSLSQTILNSFDPAKASLGTWVNLQVKQHPELKRFLLEHGVYLISDWAILNDTTAKQLSRILAEIYQLNDADIRFASDLLDSFHAIYREARLQQRLAGAKQLCQPPTPEQLAQIADQLFQKTHKKISPELALNQLSAIATKLRRYRITAKGGSVSSVSLDQPETQSITDRAQPAQDDNEHLEFLQFYQSQFMESLDHAIAGVIPTAIATLQRKRNPADQAFVTALHLFHCQGQSMGEIAPQIGLKKQYEVTRLLKLNDLRADIRQRSLSILRDRVIDKARFYADVDRLKHLEEQVEKILDEQLAGVIEEAEAEAKSPTRNQPLKSLFARRLCVYLASRNLNP